MAQIPDKITADWLSDILTKQTRFGAVTIGKISVSKATKWNVAETAFVQTEVARTGQRLPTSFFIKIRRTPDPLAEIFPGELVFYRDVATIDLPLAPCFAALEDPETGASCLILEDLRPSHETTPWPLPPPLHRCASAMRALATTHAYWAQPATTDLNRREDLLQEQALSLLPGFLSQMGDRLSSERIALLKETVANCVHLKARRYASGRPVTRMHGDAHVWNILYPKDPSGQAILIDWEDWRIDFAGQDLAYMMALHWYPDRRRLHEAELLRTYLDTYNACAATPLNIDDLWKEYRLGHLCNGIILLFQHAAGQPQGSWWSNLERWFMAFDDLGCRALLDDGL